MAKGNKGKPKQIKTPKATPKPPKVSKSESVVPPKNKGRR